MLGEYPLPHIFAIFLAGGFNLFLSPLGTEVLIHPNLAFLAFVNKQNSRCFQSITCLTQGPSLFSSIAKPYVLFLPVVGGNLRARDIHIPIHWGAKELLGVSQPHDSTTNGDST